jgi:response regulator of citrate/malate metabolism
MSEVIEYAEEKQKITEICKEKGINIDLLSEFFKLRAQGYQTIEMAPILGVHRVTVSRYIKALKELTETEFNLLYKHIVKRYMKKENEKEF